MKTGSLAYIYIYIYTLKFIEERENNLSGKNYSVRTKNTQNYVTWRPSQQKE